jgi:capsular polysaccharide biosynthesis protein
VNSSHRLVDEIVASLTAGSDANMEHELAVLAATRGNLLTNAHIATSSPAAISVPISPCRRRMRVVLSFLLAIVVMVGCMYLLVGLHSNIKGMRFV